MCMYYHIYHNIICNIHSIVYYIIYMRENLVNHYLQNNNKKYVFTEFGIREKEE